MVMSLPQGFGSKVYPVSSRGKEVHNAPTNMLRGNWFSLISCDGSLVLLTFLKIIA